MPRCAARLALALFQKPGILEGLFQMLQSMASGAPVLALREIGLPWKMLWSLAYQAWPCDMVSALSAVSLVSLTPVQHTCEVPASYGVGSSMRYCVTCPSR